MRLVVTTGQHVREAEADEVTDVVDTTQLGRAELAELANRITDEGSGELVGRVYDAHPELFDDSAGEADGYSSADEEPSWDQGGLVTVKTTYPQESEYHGMPGLEAPPAAWLQSIDADLAAMGVNPDAAVTVMQLWWPAHGGTHYEVGAMVGGTYAKFDLTNSGYRMIFNATAPVVGQYYRGSSDFIPAGVTARRLYQTFLQVASTNGPYDMETNDCQRFATDLGGSLGGNWSEQ